MKESSLGRVREWATTINSRKEEALETLASEGVTIERFFLVTLENRDYLVAYMRAGSITKARETVKNSLKKIDAYHQEFKRTVWEKKFGTELLVDLTGVKNEGSYV